MSRKYTPEELRAADALQCDCCRGSGIRTQAAFTTREGRHYPAKGYPCSWCEGAGELKRPDVAAICAAIKGRKGLRSKRPDDRRAYYVWRMARFHGGADVTMPVTASMEVDGDPFVPILDALADAVARRVFGTDLAAAHRWGRVLGHIDRDMPGLPAGAYEGGPVADADKPLEELLELS